MIARLVHVGRIPVLVAAPFTPNFFSLPLDLSKLLFVERERLQPVNLGLAVLRRARVAVPLHGDELARVEDVQPVDRLDRLLVQRLDRVDLAVARADEDAGATEDAAQIIASLELVARLEAVELVAEVLAGVVVFLRPGPRATRASFPREQLGARAAISSSGERLAVVQPEDGRVEVRAEALVAAFGRRGR
jgi:hypothetical protein